MLTPFEQIKLRVFRRKLLGMTSEEALENAIEKEWYANTVGPADWTYLPAVQAKLDFLNYAVLLEKEENANKVKEVA